MIVTVCDCVDYAQTINEGVEGFSVWQKPYLAKALLLN